MHFYALNKESNKVEPKHFVENKSKGGLRPSRVTDAKKAAKNGDVWYPSVTGVLNILDKPALANWKVDQNLETVFELLQTEDLRSDDFAGFKRHVKAITKESMDPAPKAGTDLHKVLEDFVSKGIEPTDKIEKLICKNVVDALIENCGFDNWDQHPFICEKYFIDTTFGYAGCADLHSEEWVIDFKSKKEAAKFKPGKMAYPEHARQLGAYGAVLCEEANFKSANIFICLETGEVDFHKHTEEDVHNGYFDFLNCLEIYNRNTYNPQN